MEISIEAATVADLPKLAKVAVLFSQDDKLTQVCCGWPAPGSGSREHYDEDVAYQQSNLGQWFRKWKTLFSKAIDRKNDEIVGLCIWSGLLMGRSELVRIDQVPPYVSLPSSGDATLMGDYNDKLDLLYHEFMGFKHNVASIQVISVVPSHRRQGVARKLVLAGLELVDQAGQDVYLEATNKSEHMFERLGFEALKEIELMDGYFQKAMHRKAKVDQGESKE